MLFERVRQIVATGLARSVQVPRIAFYVAISGNRLHGSNGSRVQPVHVMGLGRVTVERGVKIGFPRSPFFLTGHAYLDARAPSASITIGTGTQINNAFTAIAEHTRISIGKRCLIGSSVTIIDSDFHGKRIEDRRRSTPENASAVNIGDDVFIGSNATILKGVSIGDGAIVAMGSVVTKSVATKEIVAGNPAKSVGRVP